MARDVTPVERELRAALCDTEILLDAVLLNPTPNDRVSAIRARIKQLKTQVAVAQLIAAG
jgi:hypothetical protein